MSKLFPHRNTFPIHVYELERIDDDEADDEPVPFDKRVPLGRAAIEKVIDATQVMRDGSTTSVPYTPTLRVTDPQTGITVSNRGTPTPMLPRVPDEGFRFADTAWWESWCYADASGLVQVGGWFMWGMRQWKRRPVPPSLVAAMVSVEADAWKERTGAARCPAAVLKEFRESVVDKLRPQVPPAIAENRVLVDGLFHRLYLFDSSESVRDRVRHRFHRAGWAASAWKLSTHLGRSRRGAVLPAEIGARFLEWLYERSHSNEWLHVHDTLAIQIAPAETARARHGDGFTSKVSMVGEDAVEAVQTALDGSVLLTELRVTVTATYPEFDAEYDLVLTDQAQIKAVTIQSGWRNVDDGHGEHAGVALKADAVRAVVDVVRHLVEAFDNSALVELMSGEPQRGLFPVEIRERPTWGPRSGKNAEAGPLFAGSTVTFSSGSESVTVSAELFAKIPQHMKRATRTPVLGDTVRTLPDGRTIAALPDGGVRITHPTGESVDYSADAWKRAIAKAEEDKAKDTAKFDEQLGDLA